MTLAVKNRIRNQQSRFNKNKSIKGKKPSGSLIYAGDGSEQSLQIEIVTFDTNSAENKIYSNPKDLDISYDLTKNYWIDVNCICHREAIDEISKIFKLHYLTIDDIISADERPKIAEFEDYVYLIVKMIYYEAEHKRINYEQVSFVIFANILITFQEFEGDNFGIVRRRLFDPGDIIRTKGTDYLTYALVDAIVDGYYSVINLFSDIIEDLEIELSENRSGNDDPDLQHQFHLMRYESTLLYRSVSPIASIITRLNNSHSPVLSSFNKKYILDVGDHVSQILENIDTLREMLASLQEVYTSNMNHRMNKVMQTLTIITSIFIPLSFIVGIYGMNFEFMPELHWQWGYGFVWFLMVSVVVGMITLFKKKGWI